MNEEIEIPNPELVEISLLKVDGENPNRMTQAQKRSLALAIKKYKWLVPIVTNEDYLIADGEQRLEVAKELGMKTVPVIKLKIQDVDRRILRQVMNKLKGEHEMMADALEFDKIINSGHEEDLLKLLNLTEKNLERYRKLLKSDKNGFTTTLPELYEVIIECKDVEEQEKVFTELKGEGYKCRVLTL